MRTARLLLALLAWAPIPRAALAASPAFHEPTPGNRYVASMGSYLYVVWSLPKSLAPLAHLRTKPELTGFLARTALHLCAESRAKNRKKAPDCLVHVLKLHTNDEYNTAASAGFTTLGKLTVPFAALGARTGAELVALDDTAAAALFAKIRIDHAKIPQRQGAPAGTRGGP
jgi:hypothetical protein